MSDAQSCENQPDYPSSPGLEEFIEAISFLHYMEHRDLIPFEELQKFLTDPETGELVSGLTHSMLTSLDGTSYS